ncbi:hypothetical protein BaRGS_00013348 [Batillaria attramentaria]|uniref:Endonuclease n=1 Tax=Batillaria attramentaria TaxID=370345 RepID=A0ABD0L7R1_9CAEN
MSTPITGKTKTTVAERLSPMSAGSGREDSASVQGLERGDRLQLWLEEAKAVAASLKLHGEALSKFIADELRSRRAEERESRLKEQLQCGELKLKVERHQEELRRENERHQEELRREGERQQEEIWRQREELRLKEDRQREELRLQEEETRLKLKRRGSPVPSPAVGTLNLKLPAFDEEKEDLDTFLGRIERGPTAEVYLELTDEQVADFEQARASLREAFQLNGEYYRRQLRSTRKQERETFPQFVTRLGRLLGKWISLSGKERTFEGLWDLVLQKQLLQIVSFELETFLRQQDIIDVKDAASRAEKFVEARRSTRSGSSRWKYDRNNRSTTKGSTEKSSKDGTDSKLDSKASTSGGASSAGKGLCHLCHNPGHYKRECPERKAKERLTVITVASSLPTPAMPSGGFNPYCRARVGDKEVTAMRDTGASTVVVDSAVLATRDDVKVCSTALVQVESPFYCGEVHAIVMPNLTVPMILGNYAERRDGTLVPLPVLRETALVLTRAGAAKERGGMRPLKVTDSELGTVTREELVRLQQDDPSLARTRNLAAAGTTKPSGKQGRVRFLWRKGVLQREYTGPSGTFYQICVPERLRPGLLRLSHDVPMAGHLGCKKTQDRLQPGFYWPAQASDVRRYVASCDACQRTVPRGRIGKVPLGKHPLIDKPFRRVGVDLVGPIIPASDRKNRYILVAVDYATRYPEAVPLPSIEAERVAEALREMWTRLGVPREVLTDNGAQFASELMSEVNRLLCIRGLTTTPYHAQCNGLVERFNGTLKAMLRKLCQDRPRDWDRFVPALLFAYREVPQESLGFSPFELLYGRTDSDEEVKTTVQYVLDLRERLEAMSELARKNLGRSAERYATAFNRPYEVVERAGEADYRIRVGDRIKLFHANLLKAYQERDRVQDPPPPAPRVRTRVALVVDESLEEDAPGRSDELPVPVLTPEEGPTDVSLNPELPPGQREKILRVCEGHSACRTDPPGRTNLEEFSFTLGVITAAFLFQGGGYPRKGQRRSGFPRPDCS